MSQVSLQKFNVIKDMMLTLEHDTNPELDYEGIPSPQKKSTVTSPLDEESLLKSPSPTKMEVVGQGNEDTTPIESSGMSSTEKGEFSYTAYGRKGKEPV